MSEPINDGGRAFPEPEGAYSGMSLRAYLTGCALASTRESDFSDDQIQAMRAVSIADATLAELSKAKP